jgi:hypothetical protein
MNTDSEMTLREFRELLSELNYANANDLHACESGVALRLPPHSMTRAALPDDTRYSQGTQANSLLSAF